MNILAFDTACGACSAAVWRDGRVASHSFEPMSRGHAEALIPVVRRVLVEARLAFRDLGCIAVTVGPGSFTGLRVGLAAARGIALSYELPVIGVTTLEAVACDARAAAPDESLMHHHCLVVLETKRNDVYAQSFAAMTAEPLCEPAAIHPDDIADLLPTGYSSVLVAGDAAARVHRRLADAGVDVLIAGGRGLPVATTIAAIAAARLVEPIGQRAPPEPLYLRPPMARLPHQGGRLRP